MSDSRDVVNSDDEVLRLDDSAVDAWRCSFQRQTIVTSPLFVNLTALEARLPMTCGRSRSYTRTHTQTIYYMFMELKVFASNLTCLSRIGSPRNNLGSSGYE